MGCDFCGHSTPHSCWDADEASNCGNYLHARDAVKSRHSKIDDVEKIITDRERRMRPPTAAQIEARERKELARLKRKYEGNGK